MNFFYLLNSPKKLLVYAHTTSMSSLIYAIKLFRQNKKNAVSQKLVVIYSSDQNDTIKEKFENVELYYSTLNFEPALLNHNKLKDRLANKVELKEKFNSLYDAICLTAEEVNEKLLSLNKKLNFNINQTIVKCKNDLFSTYTDIVVEDSATVDSLIKFIHDNICNSSEFDFKTFFSCYAVPCMTGAWFGGKTIHQTVTFNNVYYRNKGFYNADGSFFDISEISQDIEYKDYNKTKLVIDTENAIQVSESVLFLDYIYDFYNFGEFWDIIKRLIYFNKEEPVELYGLSQNRILNIEKYFSAFKITYPPKYCRDYKYTDVLTETNKGSTYFFKKLYITTINNSCRGEINPWSAFKMNELFNPHEVSEKGYNLYLTRGKEKRGIVNEEHIIQNLLGLGFIILDGSETLDKQMYYFTNAKIIIGAHGSLMKNIVWCKKNPLFIELFPPTRSHLCFIGNAQQLGFKTLPILCEANENEEIILNDTQRKSLLELIKYLYANR